MSSQTIHISCVKHHKRIEHLNVQTPATGCGTGPMSGYNGRVASRTASGIKRVPSCCADRRQQPKDTQ